jgi:hypothetical protein
MPDPTERTRIHRHPERGDSMNYRSAVIFGRAREVTETEELLAAARPIWAGTLPLRTVVGEPVAATDLRPGIPRPDYLDADRRP